MSISYVATVVFAVVVLGMLLAGVWHTLAPKRWGWMGDDSHSAALLIGFIGSGLLIWSRF